MEDDKENFNNEYSSDNSQNESSAGDKPSSNKSILIFASLAIFTLVILFSSVSYYLGSKKITGGVSIEASPTPQSEELESTPTLQEEGDVMGSITTSTPTSTVFLTLTPTNTATPTLTLTPTVTPTPQADLKVSDYKLSTDPGNPTQGVEFTISFSIYNQGNKSSGPFSWEWWPTKYSAACRQRIDNLVARGGRVVSCEYTYGGWSTYETKVVADSENEISESNETNNSIIRIIRVNDAP